jgi:hypothetical protein
MFPRHVLLSNAKFMLFQAKLFMGLGANVGNPTSLTMALAEELCRRSFWLALEKSATSGEIGLALRRALISATPI